MFMKSFRHAALSLLCVASVFLVACQTDALTGKSTLNIYSYDDEKRMGDEAVQRKRTTMGRPSSAPAAGNDQVPSAKLPTTGTSSEPGRRPSSHQTDHWPDHVSKARRLSAR